jgi:hypothetical protein
MDKGWNCQDEKSGQEAFDQPGDFGEYANTNLPKDYFRFKDKMQIYWLVELTRFPGDKKMHNVQVRDYGVKTIGLFNPGLNHF